MSLSIFQQCLVFLEQSGIDQVRILGGEPTLHPEFKKFMNLAMETGKRLFLFTNGLMPEKTLKFLAGLPRERLNVMVNATARFRMPESETVRRRSVLKKLGSRAMLSFTIYRPDVSLDGLLDLINGTTVERRIRLGLALPCLTEDNEWLHPRLYRFVGSSLVDFVVRAARQKISVGLDCGFVPCMFSKSEIQTLKVCDADLNWNCSPILDIDPTGRVLHCFPLAKVISTNFPTGLDASTVRNYFREAGRPFRNGGIYKKCFRCDWKQANLCPGGCLAVILKRIRNCTVLEIPPKSQRLSNERAFLPELRGPGGSEVREVTDL